MKGRNHINLGIVVVEVCESNEISSIDIETLLEMEYPEVSVLKLDCLNLCGLCKMRPFAMVDGVRVFAKTKEACLQKIKVKIVENIQSFNEMNDDDLQY